MAFSKGDLITAYKLNEINKGISHEWGGKPLDLYMHSGGYIEWSATGMGDLAGTVKILKWNGESYATVFSKSVTGGYSFLGGEPTSKTESGTVYITSIGGEGYYQMEGSYYTGSYTPPYDPDNPSQGTIQLTARGIIIAYPVANAIRGDYLVQFDNSDRSGNRISGNHLTAEILNSGTVGTMPVLI